jgi:hypothetical protein
VTESFYDTLSNEMTKLRVRSKDVLAIAGDWNARPVSPNSGAAGVLGRYQYGPSNYNSNFWLDWCAEWNCCVPISFLRKSWRQRSTWFHPSSRKWFCQDAFVIQQSQRQLVHDTRAINGVMPISDHKPVVMRMVLPGLMYNRKQRCNGKIPFIQLQDPEAVERYQNAIQEEALER